MNNFESGPINLHDDGTPLRWEEAAHRVTVNGWACVKCKRFYGDGAGAESAARYCCHTDAPCECGARKTRHRVLCDSCYHESKIKRWEGLYQAEWDGKSMLTTLDGDRYFSDTDELVEWCVDQAIRPSDAFVIHCEEHGPPQMCLSEIVSDYLPEDHEFDYDAEAKELEKRVNDYLASKRPWSWYPDYKRRPTDAFLRELDDEYNVSVTTATPFDDGTDAIEKNAK